MSKDNYNIDKVVSSIYSVARTLRYSGSWQSDSRDMIKTKGYEISCPEVSKDGVILAKYDEYEIQSTNSKYLLLTTVVSLVKHAGSRIKTEKLEIIHAAFDSSTLVAIPGSAIKLELWKNDPFSKQTNYVCYREHRQKKDCKCVWKKVKRLEMQEHLLEAILLRLSSVDKEIKSSYKRGNSDDNN